MKRQKIWQSILLLGLGLTLANFFVFERISDLPNIAWPRLLQFAIDVVLFSALLIYFFVQRRRSQDENKKHTETQDQRFRTLFGTRMMGLLISDFQGKIHEANDYFISLIGYDRATVMNGELNWHQITPREHIKRSREALEELRERGLIQPFEKEYVRKDGSRVPVLIGSALINKDTALTYILDITDKKKTERALAEAYSRLEERVALRTQELSEANAQLRQSQSFLDSVVENIPNMIFVKDAESLKFVRFNKAGEDLVGHPREALVGKSDYDFFPAEQADFFTEKDRAVLRGRVMIDIPEEPIKTPQGIRYLHTKKIPVYDKVGKPRYLLGISEDITEKKMAEKQRLHLLSEQAARQEAEKTADRLKFLSDASAALSESLDRKIMLKSFAQVIVRHMADWCSIDVVDSMAEGGSHITVAHTDPSKVIWAEKFRRQFPPNWNAKYGVAQVVRTGEAQLHRTISEEFLRQISTSEDFYDQIRELGISSVMIVPLKSFGKAMGAITFVSTDRNHLFDEIDLSVAQDLAKRAFFALEHARLYDKSLEASRAKSTFLANMSHEIRTPLGAMLGFAEVMMDASNLTSTQINALSTIIRNGQQLLHIVNDILDLSKVESEHIVVENLPFSLNNLVYEITQLLNVKAKEKGLDFKSDVLTDSTLQVMSDPTRIRQILINVIGNAIKFTQEGQVTVTTRLIPSDLVANRGLVEFTVTDSGIGISPEQQERIFQPFVQADQSTTRRFGGTGLGLLLSQKLTRLLGGDLVLESSTPGVGSKFVITIQVDYQVVKTAEELPRMEAPKLLECGTIAEPPVGLTADVGQTEGAKQEDILIVEDSLDNQVLFKYYLTQMGFRVDVADNGRRGVEKALAHEYSVILMDIQMPEMDGFEAVKVLRAKGYQQPILALTAHAMKGDREQCLESGFDDYICKPIERENFRKTVQKYIH